MNLKRIATLGIVAVVSLGMGAAAVAAVLSPNDPSISGSLQLWLKSDTGVTADGSGFVSNWADQSGNGNDASQGSSSLQPKLIANGMGLKPSIRFDGTGDYMQSAWTSTLLGSAPSEATVFFMFKPRNDDGNRNFEYALQFQRAAGVSFLTLVNDGYYSGGNLLSDADTLGVFGRSAGAWNSVHGTDTLAQERPFAVSYGFDNPGSGDLFLRLNGSSLGSTSATMSYDGSSGNSPLRIGGTSGGFGGDVAEVIVYDTALTLEQIQGIETYLLTTYPVPEPATLLVWSLLAGLGVGLGWRRRR